MRLLPGSRVVAHQLAGTAGACRFVWNHILARKQQQYRAYQCWQDYKIGPEKAKPQLSCFSLNKEFTALRRDPEYAWLREYSFTAVRYGLKYLADAYQAFFQGQCDYPGFKRQHAHQDGFTLPDRVRVRDHQLYVPRCGWLRLKGSNLYADGQPLQARIRQEGTRARPSGTSISPTRCPRPRCGRARQRGCWGWTAMWDRSPTAKAPGTP